MLLFFFSFLILLLASPTVLLFPLFLSLSTHAHIHTCIYIYLVQKIVSYDVLFLTWVLCIGDLETAVSYESTATNIPDKTKPLNSSVSIMIYAMQYFFGAVKRSSNKDTLVELSSATYD